MSKNTISEDAQRLRKWTVNNSRRLAVKSIRQRRSISLGTKNGTSEDPTEILTGRYVCTCARARARDSTYQRSTFEIDQTDSQYSRLSPPPWQHYESL